MATTAVERRLYVHAVCSRAYLYIPVVVHHIEWGLETAGFSAGRGTALAIVSLWAIGIAVAEFPSGVFADWAGRVRALQVCGVLLALGMLCYLWPAQVWLLAVGQLVVGVGSGFLSGADTALLHQHLEATGRPDAFGRALPVLRFWNAVGLILGAGLGGLLYEWWWPSVWLGTIALQLVGVWAVAGISEPPRPHAGRSYGAVLRDALAFAWRDRRLRVLLVVAGAGSALYGFAIWTVQMQPQDAGAAPRWWGLAVAGLWVLSALVQPLSARFGGTAARSARLWPALLAALPLAFATVWGLQAAGGVAAATGVSVLAAAATALYRNACNVELQHRVGDALRASLVSLWNWLMALWYAALFPLFGWCLERSGPVHGYGWIAAIAAGLVVALLGGAALAGVWRGRDAHRSR